uniref:Ribosomal protein L5 n=1 Tax=Cryptomonas curvata TaxID=233186 RepID=A0A2P1G8E9_9CRYP|nr:ribosomal protein L5 [Cryptomonas curvata]AVM81231.1 ribosomal protein L5 [Cryptomonas curvata]
MNNLKLWYKRIIKIDSVYKMNIVNCLQEPKIESIAINICSKSIIEESKAILYYIMALKLITNQTPVICKAKKSLAQLKLRKGMLIGTKVTLRNQFLYNFLIQFIFLVLPNIKETKFYNLNKGSLSIGIKDLLVFPQLSRYYDKFPKNMTAIINFSTNTKDKNFSRFLFTSIQIPVKNKHLKF